MGVDFRIGENFLRLVLTEVEANVPASENLIVISRDLAEPMIDVENIIEIGERGLFTPNEWVQILYFNLVLKDNHFKTDSYNISYLRLENEEILAVYATFLGSSSRLWQLGANRLDARRRKDVGRRLFSRSQ
jgi:hypothetical protein